MSHVIEVNSLEQLSAYRDVWSKLLPETPGATFFHSYEWFEAYWRHFGQGQRLRVLVVSTAQGPIGILPLVVRRESTRAGRVRVLTYPLHDWGTFYGPIGPHPSATLLAGLAHVRRTPRDWDLLDLRWVPTEGVDQGRTMKALEVAGFRPHEQAWDTTSHIDLRGGIEGFWASRTSKFRNNMRRQERRLAERGDVTHVRYRPLGEAQGDCDPRWDLYEQCLLLARRSWQGSSSDGTTISHASIRAFLSDAHVAAARLGALDMNLLYIGQQPVAFAYNYCYQGSIFGLRVGFDADAAKEGAGNVLYVRTIEDSCHRGDQTYDLGPGSLDYKKQFQTHLATSYRYTHYAPGAQAQLLRLKHWWQARREQPAQCA